MLLDNLCHDFFQDFKPVHAAAYMGDLDCLMALGEAGADLAAPSKEGFTALSAPFLNKNLTVEKIKPIIDYLLANAQFGKAFEQNLGPKLSHKTYNDYPSRSQPY